jgi:hypothetical protein
MATKKKLTKGISGKGIIKHVKRDPAVPVFPSMGALGYITFESYGSTDTYKCTALLGDGTPVVKDGYAGWQSVPRARRRALTEWVGNNPLTIDIPILFNGFASNSSQEAAIRQLEKMAGLDEDMGQPPYVAFDSGGVVQHDASHAGHIDWVISDIQWGDADRRDDGHRTRQAATVTMMQVPDDDRLSLASPAQKRLAKKRRQDARKRAQKGAKKKVYVVKAGETLETIAARTHEKGGLGNAKRWRDQEAQSALA